MRIGLNKEKTAKVNHELNIYLSNLHVLYTKIHNLHWNVVGVGFYEMHLKLEEFYTATALELDEIAERILTLEGRPLASMKDYIENATLKEIDSKPIKPVKAAELVFKDFQKVLKHLREISVLAAENSDEQTVGMLDNYIGIYEKNLWMLGAYLEN
ncbi:DNA starvation/stationary phase protection protein [Propionigenium maris DSM 9537]|uniref:DNA starvation/stationary phase protection protein n=1 Tax=Propionigenium maris DSM 9537 TaxID=1123000 RepID=A0A9W6LLV4_9FUSO|nr:DNA starvation/stationary phase protection protein [Propionigenium maris]GLI54768.1 DNA starvation/stationary phase protection protein [Propionigenium maris DSM 9537]